MVNDLEHLNGESNGAFKVSPREILMRYIHFFPWFLLSLATTLSLAFINLRYSTRFYNVSGNIQVKESNPYGGSGKFDEIFSIQPDRSLNDEMQIIRSRTMAKRVIEELNLQTSYYALGKVRTTIIYPPESPIKLDILYLKDSTRLFSLQVEVVDDRKFVLGDKKQPILFGQTFETSSGVFSLRRTGFNITEVKSELLITWSPEERSALNLIKSLKVTMSGDAASILQLTYETENPKLGVAIVNQFMAEYSKMGLEDKNQIAESALDFIDKQLDTVQSQLGNVENNLRGFREANRIYSPEQQSIQVFADLGANETRITEQSVRLKLVEYLIGYVNDEKNLFKVGMSTLGVDDPTLAGQVVEFNRLQIQRETLLKTTLPENPAVKDLEAAIIKLRDDITGNLQRLRITNESLLADMNSKNKRNNSEISSIPLKEKQLLDITRQQKIMEELFSYLLQKKLETAIGRASTLANSKVIESALSSGIPVKPNKQRIYMFAIFLGLAIPGLIIFVIEFLNDKVRSREDIEKNTHAPILGEIGHSIDKKTLVVKHNSRKYIAEQFRIIRTNLQYVLPKTDHPTILITSSFSGEGKSFVSVNIGAVIALTGKKTVVMEFDIRKPKITSNLNIQQKIGISNYIIGNAAFKELPIKVPDVDNLYVIACGPIPPNPAELLLNERLAELFIELKKEFDVVIIDTAPVGLVSDAVTLGKFADTTLYILRHNYTFKKQIRMIDELYVQKRLPSMSLIINDISMSKAYGNYQSIGSYGSTYGNSYGNEGYYEVESPKRNLFKKIFSRS